MQNSHTCLICKSDNVEAIETVVGGFLTERMFAGKLRQTNLIHCKDCGFAYYDLRPDDVAMASFYSGYRNSDYQKQRIKYDCWYSAELNDLIGKNETEVYSRKANLTKIIKSNIKNVPKINSVLDYGGDNGQHIPDIFSTAQRFVYDISGVEALEGMKSYTDINEVKCQKYDFVMCAHTLEHVCSPESIMSELKEIVAKDGYLYIELPFDNPFYSNLTDKFQFLFNKYFSPVVLFKHFWNQKMSKHFTPMNEHINFFTKDSTEKLLKSYGFKILYSDIATVDVKWCQSRIISVLAKLM